MPNDFHVIDRNKTSLKTTSLAIGAVLRDGSPPNLQSSFLNLTHCTVGKKLGRSA